MLKKIPYATACQYLQRMNLVGMHISHGKREGDTTGEVRTQGASDRLLHVTYITGLGGAIRVGLDRAASLQR
jgi:hypothetical protein